MALNTFDPVMAGGISQGGWPPQVRHLEASRTPDAYGVQILNDIHLSHTTNLDAWEVTTVAPGRHLVQARDQAAWFATNPPSAITSRWA